MPHLIIYQNKKQETKFRIVDTPIIDIGTYTSMGWYVLDIQIFYNKRFYSLLEYEIEYKKNTNKKKGWFKWK